MVSDIILSKFISYLESNHLLKDDRTDAEPLTPADINIFEYDDEFKEFIIKEQGADSSIRDKNIFEIISMDGQYSDGNAVQDINIDSFVNSETPIAASLEEVIAPNLGIQDNPENYSFDFLNNSENKFSDEEIGLITTLFDADQSGDINFDEFSQAQSLLSMLDGDDKDISEEDIDLLKKYIDSKTALGMTAEEIIKSIKELDGDDETLTKEDFAAIKDNILTPEQIESIEEAAQEGIQNNDVMESAGAGSSSSSHHPAAPAIREKNIANMSIEDLEKELQTAQTNKNNAYDAYFNEVEKINSELTQKISDKKDEIDTTNETLDCYNKSLSENKESLSSAQSNLNSINSQISELESQLSKDGADTATINEQISTLKKEKEKLENETIPDLEEKISDTEEKIREIEDTTLPKLEKELEDFNSELFNQASEHPELQAMLDEYNNATNYEESIKQTLDVRKSDKEKEEASNRPDVNQGPKDYRDEEGYNFENMPMTYTLNGEKYNCVGFHGYDTDGDGKTDFKPDSWEEMQRYFANAGIANIGKYGSMQCHNYSNVMVDVVMGTVNTDILNAMIAENDDPNFGDLDLAGNYGSQGKYNPRDCLQCKVNGRDGERAIIENELQNGRPCLVSVPYTGGCHWVTAVGMSENGDILIWDSYDGSMQKLGRSSDSDTNTERRNMAGGNGVMVVVPGSSYQYATHGYLNYWSDWVNQTAEYAIERDKANR